MGQTSAWCGWKRCKFIIIFFRVKFSIQANVHLQSQNELVDCCKPILAASLGCDNSSIASNLAYCTNKVQLIALRPTCSFSNLLIVSTDAFLVYPKPFCFAYPLFVRGTANVRREADTDPKGLLLLSFTDRSVRHYSTKSVSGRGSSCFQAQRPGLMYAIYALLTSM